MISELTFSREYGSFWRAITPTSEAFVRRVNLGLSERWCRPLGGDAPAGRRAFVNELGFCLFRELGAGPWRGRGWVRPSEREALVRAAISEAWKRVGGLAESGAKVDADVPAGDLQEAFRIGGRLQSYFRDASELVIEPTFPGCGIIDECKGDVLSEKALVEIKAGERPFRSIDIRQVLTYLALNQAAAGPWIIFDVCLLNPRLGLEFRTTVQDLCFNVSGLEAKQLLDSVSFEMSRSDVSR